ncbi:hypothetical protein HDU67_006232 [Dinochytrium kinnereticum]|nr:hypothetical protein HDU67_006232 [Dinochytrium kinnereticum]
MDTSSTRNRTSMRSSRSHGGDDKTEEKVVEVLAGFEGEAEKRPIGRAGRTVGMILLISTILFIYLPFSFIGNLVFPFKRPHHPQRSSSSTSQCIQPPLILPTPNVALDEMYERLFGKANEGYAMGVARRLAGMVRINTEAFDDQNGIEVPRNGAVADPDFGRRRGFVTLRDYVGVTWPKVHSTLDMEVVNRYGMLYRWKGSDLTKGPILLTAHLDTVPVPKETLSQWTYPPFNGTIADGWVWGRGAHDCKAQMIEILEAVENLIIAGFTPKRTILIAFGFDEEIGGIQGAKFLAKRIHDMGHHNGLGGIPVAFLLDEGSGISTAASIGLSNNRERDAASPSFAAVSTSEKGYMDVEITVKVPGGHSSAPPKRTGIGLAALVVKQLDDHPFELEVGEAVLEQFGCWTRFGAVEDLGLVRCVGDVIAGVGGVERRRELVERVGGLGNGFRALLGTTQAVDVIKGGVKVNSLPELVTITVNYRIAAGSTVGSTEAHLLKTLQPLTKAQNLTLHQTRATGESIIVKPPSNHPSQGTITVETLPDSFDPSPVAPSNSRAFHHVSSAIRRTLVKSKEEVMVVHAGEVLGNTDTIHYGDVVGRGMLMRFSPLRDVLENRIHTVDERVRVEDVVRGCGFFFELLRGVDGDTAV